jgi:polysaccharide export outer membrane protein
MNKVYRSIWALALVPGVLLGAVYQADAPAYRLGPKDLVEVHVQELPELNVQRRVNENGAVFLPLLGEVIVAGLSAEEMAARLTQLLEQRFVQPGRATVEIQVREFRAKPISIIGAVSQPGPLAFPGRWTLLEALTAAGGLAGGHGGIIYVLRRADNGLTDQVAIRVDDLFGRADPSVNIPIYANDLINVPAASSVNVYCLGEVNHPGSVTFSSTERITVLATIARAGGLTDRASSKILVRRADQGAGQLRVDYKRILSGREPDLELAEGDVLVIKEAFF